jgi:SAM-dependent methyltransferase
VAEFDPTFYHALSLIEDRHFWFRARNEVISVLAKQVVVGLPPGYRVLEAGAGTGNVLRVLEQSCRQGRVTGMDLFAQGLTYARRRTTCSLVQGDMRALPFGVHFDVIGAFDVLEHLSDDEGALRCLAAALKEDGVLLLTVPAHPSLWSYFDEASHHCRRYARADLETKLLRCGYRLEYVTEYMASPLPLMWLRRRLSSSLDRGPIGSPEKTRDLTMTELQVIPILNDVLALSLWLEARLMARRCRLPFGTSVVAVARKVKRDPATE